MYKIIVLDRDGVVNQDSDDYIKSVDEWVPIPRSIEAIRCLKKAGWIVAIASNQSGLRRGYYDHKILSAIHQKLQALLKECPVDWISFSGSLVEDNSPARKPNVGMLTMIEQRFNLSLKGSPMVGDTLADVKVALAKGMQPYLVRTGKGERTLASKDTCLDNVPVYDNLMTVVESLLK